MDMLSSLPLKRDEFYTLLGGFFVAVAWTSIQLPIMAKFSDIRLITIFSFILIWVIFTTLLFLFRYVLPSILVTYAKRFIKRVYGTPFKAMDMEPKGVNTYDINRYTEIMTLIHITNVIIGSALLSSYPLFKLFGNMYGAFHLVMLFVIVIELLTRRPNNHHAAYAIFGW